MVITLLAQLHPQAAEFLLWFGIALLLANELSYRVNSVNRLVNAQYGVLDGPSPPQRASFAAFGLARYLAGLTVPASLWMFFVFARPIALAIAAALWLAGGLLLVSWRRLFLKSSD
jgi:hypothetical protein